MLYIFIVIEVVLIEICLKTIIIVRFGVSAHFHVDFEIRMLFVFELQVNLKWPTWNSFFFAIFTANFHFLDK